MKKTIKVGHLALLVLVALFACNEDDNAELNTQPGELLAVERTTSNIWEGDGEIDYTEFFTIDIEHPSANLEVKSVDQEVIDDLNADYTFVVGLKDVEDNSVLESVDIEYQVRTTGAHVLNFYYQQDTDERVKIGDFTFALDN